MLYKLSKSHFEDSLKDFPHLKKDMIVNAYEKNKTYIKHRELALKKSPEYNMSAFKQIFQMRFKELIEQNKQTENKIQNMMNSSPIVHTRNQESLLTNELTKSQKGLNDKIKAINELNKQYFK